MRKQRCREGKELTQSPKESGYPLQWMRGVRDYIGSPLIHMLKSQPPHSPITQNVTVFGDQAFEEMITFKGSHWSEP